MMVWQYLKLKVEKIKEHSQNKFKNKRLNIIVEYNVKIFNYLDITRKR